MFGDRRRAHPLCLSPLTLDGRLFCFFVSRELADGKALARFRQKVRASTSVDKIDAVILHQKSTTNITYI